jgi:hypothetical protein
MSCRFVLTQLLRMTLLSLLFMPFFCPSSDTLRLQHKHQNPTICFWMPLLYHSEFFDTFHFIAFHSIGIARQSSKHIARIFPTGSDILVANESPT